jgi:peptidoglycan/LPS O-acetylase OafA/YrhL
MIGIHFGGIITALPGALDSAPRQPHPLSPAMKNLALILPRDQNSFDLLRTLAAMAVMVGHAFALHPDGGWTDPVSSLFGFTYSGALAVDIFFFLSGILITSSYCQSRSVTRFVLMRVSRIWPGLICCLAVSTLIVGPMVTSDSMQSYFSAWGTRWYFVQNIKLQEIVGRLPGVFTDNHYKNAVNGSLWTLPIEIRCYVMVLVLGVLGSFKNPWPCVGLALVLALLSASNNIMPFEVFRAFNQSETTLPLLFALGMLCYIARNYIYIDWRLSAVALIAAVSFRSSLSGIAAFYLFILNTALVFAASRSTRLRLGGDYSYGIYIYGFVVQQCIAHYYPGLTSYPSLVLSLPLTLGLAMLSWHWVEHPAMKMARALATRCESRSATQNAASHR